MHRAEIQAAAVKLTKRAEECFEHAQAQHRSADLQHASARELELLGTTLLADAAELFGEPDVLEAPGGARPGDREAGIR